VSIPHRHGVPLGTTVVAVEATAPTPQQQLSSSLGFGGSRALRSSVARAPVHPGSRRNDHAR